MPKTNELRVFISSTFRDLQEEREHLVKKIFPKIRALCRKRGITFTEVDLRWGLTEEEGVLGRVIRTCLEEIDKCRPYFIGMIGSRYGWVPEFHEIMMDPDLLAKYPWIEEIAIDGVSVTEMEFIHGVFDAPQIDGEYAFFYHRVDNGSEADDPERLAMLIERARSTGHPFQDFNTVEELGQKVEADLMGMIDRYWPETHVPSPLELKRRAHTAFAASRTHAYIPNPLYLKEFTKWVNDSTTPLVVHGNSGLGKSSLVAYLTDYFRKKNPTAFTIEHYVGASDGSGSALAVMRHVVEEIAEKFSIDEKIPTTQEELEKNFANWLFRAEHLADRSNTQLLIVIDAVNQLGEYGRRLAWLPKIIPSNIRLLISTTPGETEDLLRGREWQSLEVTPIDEERIRQSIVVRYLGEFRKGISPDQLRRLTSDPKAHSPLYLRVVAEELRLHGTHETIDEQINHYTEAEDFLAVFGLVLERLEHDHGKSSVRDILCLICLSRSGLSETELLALTGLKRLDLSHLLFAFDYHLIRRDDLLGFFHNYLRYAVEQRYLTDEVRDETHHRIATYFKEEKPDKRTSQEIVWQYRSLENHDQLAHVLTSIPSFVSIYEGESRYEVLSTWKGLIEAGKNPQELYLKSLKEYKSTLPEPEELINTLSLVVDLLHALGYWNTIVELSNERLDISTRINDRKEMAKAELGLGRLHTGFGDLDQAIVHTTRAEVLYKGLNDREGIAKIMEITGHIHAQRGQYNQALELYEQALTISEKIGSHQVIAKIQLRIGVIQCEQGSFKLALETYQKALEVNQELGNQEDVASILGNMGIAYSDRGEIDKAIPYFQKALDILEQLGSQQLLAAHHGNIGNAHSRQQDYTSALEHYTKQLDISTALGDAPLATIATSNIGFAYSALGENAKAFTYIQQSMQESKRLEQPRGLVYTSLALAQLLHEEATSAESMPEYLTDFLEVDDDNWRRNVLNVALETIEEQLQVIEEMSLRHLIDPAKTIKVDILQALA